MSSSSVRPTASATRSGYSPGGEMDSEEPLFDCNFPELLVKDLENAEGIFSSKAMTAGCPYDGLEAPELSTSPPSQRARPPYSASYQQHHQGRQGAMDKLRLHSPLTDEANSCLKQPSQGRQRRVENGSPDSSSVTSAGMEPLSIRTRQQSVTTAATSLSGRCSSLFSHSTLSPTSPMVSPCSSNREGSMRATWYEDEGESPQDEPGTSVFTARTSISESHQPTLICGDEDSMAASRKPTPDRDDIPTATALYFAGGCYGTHSRPHTPASQLHLEKPRIIDIPPIALGPNRTASQNRRRCGAESTSITPERQEKAATIPVPIAMTEPPREAVYGDNVLEQAESMLSLLVTANGRTVIDASSPPPIPFARRDHLIHHPYSSSPPRTAMDEGEFVDCREVPGTKAYAEGLSEAHEPSLADLRGRIEASVKALDSPQYSAPYTPNACSPTGIPLPPEVIESLRVSISCFPETMLLTSSLSIETIRTYSRKLTHRANPDRHLRGTDSDSIYSLASHNPKPSKRWNMSWLGHPRRSSKSPHQHQHLEQYHHSLPPLIASSQAILSNLTPTTTANQTQPWSPLQTIFPSASPHLCDALYAHLLAYNYVASLCPTPMPIPIPPPRPATARVKTTSHHDFLFGSPSSSGHGDGEGEGDRARGEKEGAGVGRRGRNGAGGNLRIPQKAASLLGMDDPVSASASAAARYKHQRPEWTGRGVLSRSRSACRRESSGGGHHTLTELFTPSLAAFGARSSSGSRHGRADLGVPPRSATSHGSSGAVSRSGTSGGFGGHGHGQEGQGMRELLVGLGRCVNLLVATMNTGAGGAAVEEEESWLGGEKGEVVEGIEPVLMRALCEVVRCSEEGCLGSF